MEGSKQLQDTRGKQDHLDFLLGSESKESGSLSSRQKEKTEDAQFCIKCVFMGKRGNSELYLGHMLYVYDIQLRARRQMGR